MEDIFLQAIRAEPDNTTPQLVYADWLDEQGDARGELIRLHVEVSGHLRRHPNWSFYLSTVEKIYLPAVGNRVSQQPNFWELLNLLDERQQRLFACQCAESVLHLFEKEYPGDDRPRQAIDIARAYALGRGSKEQLDAARSAARDAADRVSHLGWGALNLRSEEASNAARTAVSATVSADTAASVAASTARLAKQTLLDAAKKAAGNAAGGSAWETTKDTQFIWVVSWLLGFCDEE